MIFLTNKFELYTAILRNTITKLILKNGICENHLKMLKKIHIAEALNSEDLTPLNIKKFAFEVLSLVYIKKTENDCLFRFLCSANGNFIINKKAFLALILSLSKSTTFLNIKGFKNGIVIKCDRFEVTNTLKLLIKKLNAIYFFERKEGILSVLFFPTATSKKSCMTAKDRDILHGPLSLINCYLIR